MAKATVGSLVQDEAVLRLVQAHPVDDALVLAPFPIRHGHHGDVRPQGLFSTFLVRVSSTWKIPAELFMVTWISTGTFSP